ERGVQQIGRRLALFDVGRRLASIRTRLVGVGGRLAAAITERRHRCDARLRGCPRRLEGLSPLAGLGRGYAVRLDGSRTRVIRDAAEVQPGDRLRVTLARGELGCEAKDILER